MAALPAAIFVVIFVVAEALDVVEAAGEKGSDSDVYSTNVFVKLPPFIKSTLETGPN